MFTEITSPQRTRLQYAFSAVKTLVGVRRDERGGRSRGLTRLLDLDSERFDLAVSRAKPLVFPEGRAVDRLAPLSARLSKAAR